MKYKLNKIKFNDKTNTPYERFVNINILDFINSKLVKNNDTVWNYRDDIILIQRENITYFWSINNNKLNKLTERYFISPILGYGIYKDINTFSQNNEKVSNIIYDFVIKLLEGLITKLLKKYKNIEINGIGGEFYVYFKILKYNNLNKIQNNTDSMNTILYNGYSNNIDIINASKKNNSCNTYRLIDYNTYDFNMVNNGITLINLSKINKNIIKNLKTKYVVSINCNDKTIYDDYKSLVIKEVFNLNNVKITIFKII
tara:strand:- start:2916 stop:3686 length:771 start_codon:yes stop_codon:yes gene_type:complete